MRRKLPPNPLAKPEGAPRPLVAAAFRMALPTAAALALALAGMGCSGAEPEGAISADKVTITKSVPSVEPSASASTTPAIDPTPMPLPGEMMIVSPPPPPVPSTKPHKTAGKPANIHPSI
jgi:hypothetical protein